MERTPDPAMSPGYGASGLHTLPAPSGSPDGYDELTVERLRLLVNSISYDARARVFEVEETLAERRAGSEETACGKSLRSHGNEKLSVLLTLFDRFRRDAALLAISMPQMLISIITVRFR
jgi:hypothetical protein